MNEPYDPSDWFPMSQGMRAGEPPRDGLPWVNWFMQMLYANGKPPPGDVRLAGEIVWAALQDRAAAPKAYTEPCPACGRDQYFTWRPNK